MSRSSSLFAALSRAPSDPMNLSAFQLASLWLPVMEIPPAAPAERTPNETAGVGQTPRSITCAPVDIRAASTAEWSITELGLVSRPTTTVPPSQ